ncbi:MAG TPA: L,D-transpeptidase family protein [Alphaproteobacteria bacterium]|jgi:murein L,D-transpeptidase YafK|nr:L,D-transpeptidase family protein [Alphaproteobacteria bacterium]
MSSFAPHHRLNRRSLLRCGLLAVCAALALGADAARAAPADPLTALERRVEAISQRVASLEEPGPIVPLKADVVVVEKRKRRLTLYRNGRVLHSYRIALGWQPQGRKLREGDGRTPEGTYALDWRNPDSAFHRSIHVSYPNAQDIARARRAGVAPGGQIMIHGLSPRRAPLGPAHAKRDWTEGCIAVTNREIDEIWRLVDDGTPITIRP